ncbi:MAG: PP2C family protein-serine/threonine phosphatase [Melioribacteraceae bacterium]|nr:PP2C family protein-serine/threonine phosphatase [Melioribacteraceae bacterium]
MSYSGAGDLPIFVKKDNEVSMVKSDGLLLGFNEDGDYKDVNIELNDGDAIYLISDGIIESRNASTEEQYGKDRLIDVIKRIQPDENPLDKIKKEFSDYTAGKFEDDVSLICIKG